METFTKIVNKITNVKQEGETRRGGMESTGVHGDSVGGNTVLVNTATHGRPEKSEETADITINRDVETGQVFGTKGEDVSIGERTSDNPTGDRQDWKIGLLRKTPNITRSYFTIRKDVDGDEKRLRFCMEFMSNLEGISLDEFHVDKFEKSRTGHTDYVFPITQDINVWTVKANNHGFHGCASPFFSGFIVIDIELRLIQFVVSTQSYKQPLYTFIWNWSKGWILSDLLHANLEQRIICEIDDNGYLRSRLCGLYAQKTTGNTIVYAHNDRKRGISRLVHSPLMNSATVFWTSFDNRPSVMTFPHFSEYVVTSDFMKIEQSMFSYRENMGSMICDSIMVPTPDVRYKGYHTVIEEQSSWLARGYVIHHRPNIKNVISQHLNASDYSFTDFVFDIPWYLGGLVVASPALLWWSGMSFIYFTVAFFGFRLSVSPTRWQIFKEQFWVHVKDIYATISLWPLWLGIKMGQNKVGRFFRNQRKMLILIALIALFLFLKKYVWSKRIKREQHGKEVKNWEDVITKATRKIGKFALFGGATTLVFSASAKLFIEILKDMGYLDEKGQYKDVALDIKTFQKINKYVTLVGALLMAVGALTYRAEHGKDDDLILSDDSVLPSKEKIEVVSLSEETSFFTKLGMVKNHGKIILTEWKNFVVANKYTLMCVVGLTALIATFVWFARRELPDTDKKFMKTIREDELKALTGLESKEIVAEYLTHTLNLWMDQYYTLHGTLENAAQAHIARNKVIDLARFLGLNMSDIVDKLNKKELISHVEHGKFTNQLASHTTAGVQRYAQMIEQLPTADRAIRFDEITNYPTVHIFAKQKNGVYTMAAYRGDDLRTIRNDEKKLLQDPKYVNWQAPDERDLNEIGSGIAHGVPTYARVYDPVKKQFLPHKYVVVLNEEQKEKFDSLAKKPQKMNVDSEGFKYTIKKPKSDNNNNRNFEPRKLEKTKQEILIEEQLQKEQQKQRELAALKSKMDKLQKEGKKEEHAKISDSLVVKHSGFDIERIRRAVGPIKTGLKVGTWFVCEDKLYTARHNLLNADRKLVDRVIIVDADKNEYLVDTNKFCFDEPEDHDIVWIDRQKIPWKVAPPSLPRGRWHSTFVIFIYSIHSKGGKLIAGVAEMQKYRRMADISHTIAEATFGDSGAPLFDTEGKVVGVHVGAIGAVREGMSIPDLIDCKPTMKPLEIKKMEYEVNKQIIDEFVNFATDEKVEHSATLNITDIDDLAPVYHRRNSNTEYYIAKIKNSHIKYPEPFQQCREDLGNFRYIPEYYEFLEPYSEGFDIVGHFRWGRKFTRPKLQPHASIKQKMIELGLPDCSDTHGIARPTTRSNYKDASKYVKPYVRNPDPVCHSESWNMVEEDFRDFLYGYDFLTYKEAEQRIEKTKAPGGVWSARYANKSQVYENHSDWLEMIIDQFWKTGDFPELIVSAADKEEIRALEKLLEDKIRVMNPIPTEHNHLHQCIYGRAMDILSSIDCRTSHMYVGDSVWRHGFHKISQFMHEVADESESFFESDQSKYDSHVRREIRLDMLKNFWFRMADTAEKRVHMYNAEKPFLDAWMILNDGNVIRLFNSSRFSGEPLTLHGNSILMIHIMYYCLLRHGLSKEEIRKCVRFMVLGDDNIWSMATRTGLPVFTSNIFQKLCYELGFEADPGVDKAASWMKSTFCGLRPLYLFEDKVWVFTPDVHKQMFSLQVYKGSASNTEIMMKMLALYQNLYYTPYRTQIYQLCEWWYKKWAKIDEGVKKYWQEVDPATIYRMYHPELHMGELQLESSRPIKIEEVSMKLRWHGKNCGPGWQNNKSTDLSSEQSGFPVDETDQGCQKHDFVYGQTNDPEKLTAADYELALVALKNWRPDIGLPLAVQGTLRKLGLLPNYLGTKEFEKTQIMTKTKSQKLKRKLGQKTRNSPRKKKNMRPRRALTKKGVARIQKAVEAKIEKTVVPIAPAPYKMSNNRRMSVAKNGNSMYLKDRCFIGTITNSNSSVPGTIQKTRTLNPMSLSPFMTGQMAKMYQKFRIRSHLLFICVAPSTTGGTCFAGYDPDMSDSFKVGSVVDPNNMMSTSKKGWFKVVGDFNMKEQRVLSTPFRTGWVTTPEKNFEANLRGGGQIFVGNNAKAITTATEVYEVWIEYEVELFARFSEFEFDYYMITDGGPLSTDAAFFGTIPDGDPQVGIKSQFDTASSVTFTTLTSQVPGDYFIFYGSELTTNTTDGAADYIDVTTTQALWGWSMKGHGFNKHDTTKDSDIWFGLVRVNSGDTLSINFDPNAIDSTINQTDLIVFRNQNLSKNSAAYPNPTSERFVSYEEAEKRHSILVNELEIKQAMKFTHQLSLYLAQKQKYAHLAKIVLNMTVDQKKEIPQDTTLAIDYLETFGRKLENMSDDELEANYDNLTQQKMRDAKQYLQSHNQKLKSTTVIKEIKIPSPSDNNNN
jgi:hypothetical protein